MKLFNFEFLTTTFKFTFLRAITLIGANIVKEVEPPQGGSTSPNWSEVGIYTVTYNVSDAAGNAATEVIRTVNALEAAAPEPEPQPELNPDL